MCWGVGGGFIGEMLIRLGGGEVVFWEGIFYIVWNLAFLHINNGQISDDLYILCGCEASSTRHN